MVMTEKNEPNFRFKPIFGYLASLIAFSLGITILVTLDKGWDKEDFPVISHPPLKYSEPVAVRNISTKIRQARAAGLYYPADPQELYNIIDKLLSLNKPLNLPKTRSILVPHAGYRYSGDVAATSFREITRNFNRVFILAANHTGEADFAGISMPDVSHYQIPGADIPLSDVVDELLGNPLFVQEPAAHTKYMIEVELPFLYSLRGRPAKPDFAIVPMILGRMDQAAISQLAEILNDYNDGHTLYVFSVDLSHFYSDIEARQLDSYTVQSILSRDSNSLSRSTADGPQVLLTMVALAEINGWESTMLRYKNSSEVNGDKNKVVGYGAIAFHEPFSLTSKEQEELLVLARKTIEQFLEEGNFSDADPALLDRHSILKIPRGVFVTLKKDGQLRGCIGDITSPNPLYEGIQLCAIKSATKDSRFSPVTPDELGKVVISISVLEFPSQIKTDSPAKYPSLLKPGRDGVILIHKGRQSTYLPQVWDDIPDPVMFLSRLCQKQNSPANCWMDMETILYRYGAYEFGEEKKDL
jgi:AmmeMemoRadiSam system protein B/AmmeMemoRadiSam system protein A